MLFQYYNLLTTSYYYNCELCAETLACEDDRRNKDENFKFLLAVTYSCAEITCENGGTCTDTDDGFNCLCTSQFVGEICERGPCTKQGFSLNLLGVRLHYMILTYSTQSG